MGVDPIAEDFAHVSVYNYSENEPIAHVDLWGLQKADAVHWTSVEKRMVRKGGGNPALVDAFMDGAGKVGQVVLNNTGAGDAITIFVGASEGNLNDVAQGTFDLFGGRILKPFKVASGIVENAADFSKATNKVNKNANNAEGNFVLYVVKDKEGTPLKVGKADADRVDSQGIPVRVNASERAARKTHPGATAEVIPGSQRSTTTGQMKEYEAKTVRDQRANGNQLPLNKERDKRYHNNQ